MDRQPATLQLSNGPNRPPIVHSLFEESTSTWQYVVADPSTKQCVLIDPTRDHAADATVMSTSAADAIISLVRQNGYIVQHIFETCTWTFSRFRSATWYLRMLFADVQGFAPDVSSDATLAAMHKNWGRRNGAQSSMISNLQGSMGDGDAVMIGRMRVRCIHLPSHGTPYRRAYCIGENVFGGHSLAALSNHSAFAIATVSSDRAAPMTSEVATKTCLSMQRILSLHEDMKVHLDLGDLGATEAEPSFHTVQACRDMNEYVGLDASELLVRWSGQQKERKERGGGRG